MNEQPDLWSTDLTDVEKVLEQTTGAMHRRSLPTERAAAQTVRSGTQRARVLTILVRLGDAIPHALHAEAGCSNPHVATTRLEELADPKRFDPPLVERTVERRLTPWNKPAFVWRPTDAGRKVAAELARQVAA
jgi:hypothetical protein